jgi:hypothetical protein
MPANINLDDKWIRQAFLIDSVSGGVYLNVWVGIVTVYSISEH